MRVTVCKHCGSALDGAHVAMRARSLLTRTQREIFDMIDQAGEEGVTAHGIMDELYPEKAKVDPYRAANNVQSHISYIRQEIEQEGITITCNRPGYNRLTVYRIVPLEQGPH
jgi:hypothetical protein